LLLRNEAEATYQMCILASLHTARNLGLTGESARVMALDAARKYEGYLAGCLWLSKAQQMMSGDVIEPGPDAR
jgi:hypothetical protein